MTMGHTIRKCTATFGLYFACIALFYSVLAQDVLQVDIAAKGEFGKDANFNCSVSPEAATVQWIFNETVIENSSRTTLTEKEIDLPDKDADGNRKKRKIFHLKINNATHADAGNYTCSAKLGEELINKSALLDLSFPAKLVSKTGSLKLNSSRESHGKMYCVFEVYDKPSVVNWYKKGTEKNEIGREPKNVNLKQINSTYDFKITTEVSGTYICEIFDSVTQTKVQGEIEVIVYAPPEIVDFKAIPINTTQLYLNWTVKTYNSPVVNYNLLFRELPDGKPSDPSDDKYTIYVRRKLDPRNTSFVMDGLNKSKQYMLKLEVKTKDWYKNFVYIDENVVKTLDKEPVFVPNISINGFSATSVTIGWPPPPDDIADLIHYYDLEARKIDGTGNPLRAYHSRDSRNLPYMFGNLEPHNTYVFQVRACSDYSKTCGPWSEEMQAATLDGIPGRPSNVRVDCSRGYMNLTWGPPEKPNAEIKGYTMELTGEAVYRDRYGTLKEDSWGPLTRFMTNQSRSARFDDLQPNSRYTVRVSAMTRTRRRGDEQAVNCTTPPAPPDSPPRPRWRKIIENNNYMFKMYLPRITERNGPICCYRVFMVRMLPNTDWKNLPAPKDIAVIEYTEAHADRPHLGAYVTDVFSNDKFPSNSELILGDGKSINHEDDPFRNNKNCTRCLERPRRAPREPPPPPPPPTPAPAPATTAAPAPEPTTTEDEFMDYTEDPVEGTKTRRAIGLEKNYANDPTLRNNPKADERVNNEIMDFVTVNDGPLDPQSNYTLFVELIPGMSDSEPLYSEYVNTLTPAPSPPAPAPSSAIEIALQVTCAIAAVVLLVMIIFCIMQTRRSRKLPPHAPLEMNRLQAAFRTMMGHIGGRQTLGATVPPDMPPIAREDLAAAYAERQVDSDYGFQKEFEMLPECFPDRTTHASEARENQPKNRYPDIKAYDQTRVRLSQIDSVTGSDYINANYVMGYMERKQFICAQGPTDTTVNDFWRMVWEHGLELIVMLTNLEEYSKVKCSKYWPDELRGDRAFGAITVQHVSEKRYSDYIVRELKITKQPTNADGQPIVENNGIAKRNGDCKEPSESSAPTSPRELKDGQGGQGAQGGQARTVRQYHFLMWKDFAAPEHPYSILKFIKRVNEAWANMVGRPVVVHCSAGVGRTGTLVALDCLLEQLRATGQVSVFNTVAELRRQRNFLVQSLKQYVFVYRALVEYAHYGDTEIPAARLKAAVDRLRNTPEGADKCLMEDEFDRIINLPVAEPMKSCAAGAAEEVRPKNRSADCLPYDRNRVILTPLPGRDFSTYINASFIEAYDNSEGFIITQDPLPNTIADFWRMVSEHNVSTIVMLSEIGEGKCPRYWDDGTAQYDHISVQYEESESCPYYTRRQFRVTNNKNGDTSSVRQLQYQGWPTAPGHVPEVTRGLGELCEAARAAGPAPPPSAAAPAPSPSPSPMLVHCHLGTERSALFVALCTLITQIRVERRVDVNYVTRKVRSQRARTIDTFLQYEFLHRAILNYAELHNLLEDS